MKTICKLLSIFISINSLYAQKFDFKKDGDQMAWQISVLNEDEIIISGISTEPNNWEQTHIRDRLPLLLKYNRVTKEFNKIDIEGFSNTKKITSINQTIVEDERILVIASLYQQSSESYFSAIYELSHNFDSLNYHEFEFKRERVETISQCVNINNAYFCDVFLDGDSTANLLIELDENLTLIDTVLLPSNKGLPFQIVNSISQGFEDNEVLITKADIPEMVYRIKDGKAEIIDSVFLDVNLSAVHDEHIYDSKKSLIYNEFWLVPARLRRANQFESKTEIALFKIDTTYKIIDSLIPPKQFNFNILLNSEFKGENLLTVSIDEFLGFDYFEDDYFNSIQIQKYNIDNYELNWQTTYTDSLSYFLPWTIANTIEGGAIIVGRRYRYQETNGGDIFVLEINQDGTITTVSNYTINNSTVGLYPNPISTNKSVYFNGIKNGTYTVSVFSTEGKLLHKNQYSGQELQSGVNFNLSRGYYTISVQNQIKNFVESKRLMVQ